MAIDPQQKQQWLREFHVNGFVALRGFLPVDLVRSMHEQLLPLLWGEREKAARTGFKEARARERICFDVGCYADILEGALADERYRRHPVIEELVEAILGPGQWRRGCTHVEATFKGCEPMSWHSDVRTDQTPNLDGPHRCVRVTYNIPLVDFTWVNGATEFLPGSQHLPYSSINTSGFLDVPNLYSIRLDLHRGDAVLRDGNTVHRGMSNLSDEPRPMLDQTYRSTIPIER